MPVTASLKLQKTTLMSQETTEGVAELKNDTRALLSNVNARNHAGTPTFLLTETRTGVVTTFRKTTPPGAVGRDVDVKPGDSLTFEFSLTDLVQPPAPGSYDLQVHYNWERESREAASPPVRIEVAAFNPRCWHAVTANGTESPIYYVACVNQPRPAEESFELCLATLSCSGRPSVRQVLRLEKLKRRIDPVLSVPGGVPAYVQWVAWIEEATLRFVAHQSDQVLGSWSAPRLPSGNYRIVPPLFQNPAGRGENYPGATALLYARDPGADQGEFHVAYVTSGGHIRIDPATPVVSAAPRWMETAHLPGGKRLTFLESVKGGTASLQVFPWSTVAAPKTAADFGSWPGRPLAGALAVGTNGSISGVLLLESGEGRSRRYAFQHWSSNAAGENTGEKRVEIDFVQSMGVERALLTASTAGEASALLRGDGRERPWYFASADGSVSPVVSGLQQLELPAQVLLRKGSDPTVLHAAAGYGLIFTKPAG